MTYLAPKVLTWESRLRPRFFHDTEFFHHIFTRNMHRRPSIRGGFPVSVMRPLAATVTVTVSLALVQTPVLRCGISAAGTASAGSAQRKLSAHITPSSRPSSPPLARHPTASSRHNIHSLTPPPYSLLPPGLSSWFVRGTCTINAGRRGAPYISPEPYFSYLRVPLLFPPSKSLPPDCGYVRRVPWLHTTTTHVREVRSLV